MSAVRRRARARVEGTVQGVGFRPYVHRLACELGLAGFVLNDAQGVLVEVEGDAGAIDSFFERLEPDAPPLAVVERVLVSEGRIAGDTEFAIRPSARQQKVDAPVTPDSAVCEECLRELFDPADRRYRYPFINCTNCGPRFTIVRGIPYDRPYTTMAGFRMCQQCRAEYEDPRDRRFHAQPNACPACGPSVTLLRPDGSAVETDDPIGTAARALRKGRIVAVKGIGGYHLTCRADDEQAVGMLRARKHREDKPFALMAESVDAAVGLVYLCENERQLITSPTRPIVLAPRLPVAPVANAVAPGAPELGVMLPYSPLHHLLLADTRATLVMTSGNASDEPIAFEDDDARRRLASIADLFLVHDRPIETRTDDSVVRVLGGTRRMMLRRSRGYVPASMTLPVPARRPILACGAELKNTFCLARNSRVWVSHHIGDLENFETLRSFTGGIEHFKRLFAVEPEVLVHDLHPEYLSTKYALEQPGAELVGVQHHHAHLAAALAEYGETGTAVGAIYDGSGYGADGTVWGGELLAGSLATYSRLGALWPVRLPGGERAIREPWRMACSWLVEVLGPEAPVPRTLSQLVAPEAWEGVRRLAAGGLASPLTTSVGRLFDAIAALCGVRAGINYEGQAAIELEAACDPAERGRYPMGVVQRDDRLVIDPRETIQAVISDLDAAVAAGVVATRFHRGLAAATVEAVVLSAEQAGTEIAVLSGGVFNNRRLVEATQRGLERAGLRVLIPERLPVGDGGVSYGQAAVAASCQAG